MRELKFRVWDKEKKRMSKPVGIAAVFVRWEDGDIDMPTQFAEAKFYRFEFLQFTGLKDKNDKEIYEGDIKREVLEVEEGDVNLYYLCTWIKEWAFFGWLTYEEWSDYQNDGIEGLEETDFWTFPMDHPDKDTVIGNLYEHPEKFLHGQP